jgi:DNA-binding Lrp family transcriptional regulator
MRMDRIDRKILATLQEDARITVTSLAERVEVSVSSCHRRLRDLERTGVIDGYRAQVVPAAVGLDFQAIVFVTIREGSTATLSRFETALAKVPGVTDAHRLFGDPDYLVRVATKDLRSFQRLYDDILASLPGVLRLSTTLIMKDVVSGRPLPLHSHGES